MLNFRSPETLCHRTMLVCCPGYEDLAPGERALRTFDEFMLIHSLEIGAGGRHFDARSADLAGVPST